jgi:hypothetical protein
VSTKALDRLGHGGVDLLRQADQEGKCFDIAAPDAAAVGAQDAADEGGILVVLSTCRLGRFGVNLALTPLGLGGWAAGDVLVGWLAACRGAVRSSS